MQCFWYISEIVFRNFFLRFELSHFSRSNSMDKEYLVYAILLTFVGCCFFKTFQAFPTGSGTISRCELSLFVLPQKYIIQ